MNVNLTDEELVLLDGRCSAEAQKAVAAAKSRLQMADRFRDADPKIAKFVADVVSEAVTNGILVCRHESIRYCSVCEVSAGYAVHKRTSRYHRAGTPNHDKPLMMAGKEMAERFIGFRGHVSVGCCNKCFEKAKPLLQQALVGIRAEVSQGITGEEPRFKKYLDVECSGCGWKGHEGEMLKIRALLGDGYYPGKCPKCGAENLFFGKTIIKRLPTFTVVDVAALTHTQR